MIPKMRKRISKIQVVVFILAACLVPACQKAALDKNAPKDVAEDQPLRVVLAGHLYSLYAEKKPAGASPGPFRDQALRLFAAQAKAINPQALFLLGDTTQFSSEKEWQKVESALAPLGIPWHLIPGNHDLRHQENFYNHKGLKNAAIQLGRCKFVALDNKCVYDQSDLDFLDRELQATKGIDHVFVLMHYCMITWDEAPLGQDPREEYPGVSNWNRDVVPRLAGKVEYVFCGDHEPGGPTRLVQHVGRKTIQYVKSSFVFSRAEAQREGLQTFLELIVDGDDIKIVPHILPLPLGDAWYEEKHKDETWRFHDTEQAFLWLPPHWQKSQSSPSDGSSAFTTKEGASILLRQEKGVLKDKREEKAQALLAVHPKLQRVTQGQLQVWQEKARWELIQLDPDDQSTLRFYCSFASEGEIWLFESRPGRDTAYYRAWLKDMVRAVSRIKRRSLPRMPSK